MALTANQQFINDEYNRIFGRDASFGTLGGADYWTDKLNNNVSQAEITRMLEGSQEGQSNIQNGVLTPGSGTLGGLDESKTMAENADAGNVWAKHFDTGGVFGPNADGTPKDLSNTIWAGLGTGAGNNFGTTDAAAAANNIASAVNYTPNTLSGTYTNTGVTGGGGTGGGGTGGGGTGGGDNNTIDTSQFLTQQGLTDWWNALDKSSFTGNQSGGMDDFMKFMMLMSVMGGKGGGGYGGSQYGYGGLNPGGVMQAYDPLAQLQSMGTWFKDNFGSGGATTGTVNTGTA